MAHPALITDKEFDRFLQLVRDGESNVKAAQAVGWSVSMMQARMRDMPEWQARFDEAAEQRFHERANTVDRRMDELVAEEKPAPAIVLAWAKRWNPEYREKQTVETTVTGTLEMRTPEVVEAIERFTASVVQAAAEAQARRDAGRLDAGSNGTPGLPVGELDSPP